ncbi:MAG: acetyl-CoA hydrolase/transferase family protein [Candidatus Aminicenantes bacterium]|nr:MAG: acetyl-CoA hydrolase/transferase family protein [Candidatus Aminicenantes bacterium]
MPWVDDYKKKLVNAEEAVAEINSHNRAYISGNAATPYVLMKALASRKDELEGVELVHVLLLGEDPLARPGMEGHFRHNSLFVGPADRKAINEGRADYIPIFLHQIPNLFYSGQMLLDVAVLHLSPPDEHGFMSYGVEVLASKAAAETAKIVIAQVNEKMPRVLGDSFIHVSRVHKIIEVSEDLPQLEKEPFSEVERKIGHFIAELIEDGSTLQLGIGGIPDAVLSALKGRQDLGIHTEMVSDGVMEAIENGIITGAKKTFHPYKVILTFILGSNKLYGFTNNNPIFEAHPVDYVNHPFNVSQNETMVAINSAVEVDITGQVCSDSIGTYIYSGFGGQVDFIRGAAHSKKGLPIIALPSTAKKGEISRIVPFLKRGAGVVTTRGDVMYVVTEYGVAYLHGKNLKERTEALINIAHPNFKDDLIKEAKDRNLI